jgi:hypothetical protein
MCKKALPLFCPEKSGKIYGKMGKSYYHNFYIGMKGIRQK